MRSIKLRKILYNELIIAEGYKKSLLIIDVSVDILTITCGSVCVHVLFKSTWSTFGISKAMGKV